MYPQLSALSDPRVSVNYLCRRWILLFEQVACVKIGATEMVFKTRDIEQGGYFSQGGVSHGWSRPQQGLSLPQLIPDPP
jgi:hypothetical protein